MSAEKIEKYWKATGQADRPKGAASPDEFPALIEKFDSPQSRRGFLRIAGFTFAGAVVAGCSRAPVEKAIPYLVKPEEITPGVAYYYASTCGGCSAGCGILVKNRDGRPVKLEGNKAHPISRGGLCAIGQASILGLYDSQRYKGPQIGGSDASWDQTDSQIVGELEKIRTSGGAVRLLSGTITSPTALATIDKFLGRFSDARHVVYDPLSVSAILDSHLRTHGIRTLPRYQFEKADVIVSFDADFLGTWISPVEFSKAYRNGRNLEADRSKFSYHAQFESRMSLTGSKADKRYCVPPGEIGAIMTQLFFAVSGLAGRSEGIADAQSSVSRETIDRIAGRLWRSRGNSLVACGAHDVRVQIICNAINELLGNYGNTVDIENPSNQFQGNDSELAKLTGEIKSGSVDALLIYDVNPVAELPGGEELAKAVADIPLTVSFSSRPDETALIVRYICPDHHFLESWSDSEPVVGTFGLTQPVIHPIFKTRPFIESLSKWSGSNKASHDLIRDRWREEIFPRNNEFRTFETFWDRAVHDGFVDFKASRSIQHKFDFAEVEPVVKADYGSGALALVLYPKVGMADGRHAYNPWLQELPDPITKITWDNYACISPSLGEKLGLEQGDLVNIQSGDGLASMDLPVVIQPGQDANTIAAALGYGRIQSERFKDIGPKWFQKRSGVGDNSRVGENMTPFLKFRDGNLRYSLHDIVIAKTGKKRALASTQNHHDIRVSENILLKGHEPHPIIQEIALSDLHHGSHAPGQHHREDLWPPDHQYTGHKWGMTLDLEACTGCSACLVSCQVENNIPVVGKDEVARGREMHWIRIDRYYISDGDEVEVAFQPMMCQQCDNAPCETVCPVLATIHSEEGLNQQVYNRCVGTRYCANNCPYKVRRFNWFDYPHEDKLQNLVLNPDVTVRSRGIMEKCTFCVQRIQSAKIDARNRGNVINDGDFATACEQACPADAITFGDLNDPQSRISRLAAGARAYRVLDELNVKPAVTYLKIVRNDENEKS
ncbi:MAG: hypothetical protein A2W25_13220 [candidate division Zixibacteria bacterium RBG_16_53_22]|nr:MAG: hypothetical protein A2W25_13220 [candidate division Zixibacteria bacterium RBG_16_53_22]